MAAFSPRFAATRLGASLLALALVTGCATPPPADDPEARAEWEQVNDPLEPANRVVFEFNRVVDKVLLKPVAKGYRAAVPQFGRDRVHDFLNNLRGPIVFVNDLLQGNPDRAVQTLVRVMMNTGFGLVGLIDVAAEAGIPYHDEDFGQTFAVWGVGEGPYLVLPFIGPSNPRDAAGFATEWAVDPINYRLRDADQRWAVWTRSGVHAVDKRERLLDPLDDIERNALDFYASIRALYRQRRDTEIKNRVDAEKIPAPGTSGAGRPAELSQKAQ